MPQAIAMQLPVTAAATPAAVVAGAGSATGKTPLFAGLLSRVGGIALSTAPGAGVALSKSPGGGVQAGANTGDAAPAEQSVQPEPTTTGPANQASAMPEPALPTAPLTVPAAAATSTARPRITAGVHSDATHEPAAREHSAAGVEVAADATPTPIAAMAPPPTVFEAPRHAAAAGQPGEQRLVGVAAKPGPTASAPPGNEIASAPPDSVAATPAVPPGPLSPSAAGAEASVAPLASAIATAQPGLPPAPVQSPDRIDAAPAAAPQAAAATQQVSAALVSLAGAPGGGQRMTLRLEPADLGQVQIRIDRSPDAPAQVQITVQRPETLTLLLRDQPELQRALDQAGVPPDGRGVTLHIAASDSASGSGSGNSGAAPGADPGQNSGYGGGARSDGQGRSGDATDQDPDDSSPLPLPRWLRAGLDITA
jgi:flagellar hook-length control protein FliK